MGGIGTPGTVMGMALVEHIEIRVSVDADVIRADETRIVEPTDD